jgi:hypothetical protein
MKKEDEELMVMQSIELYAKLSQREIKKSETDVVYDELQYCYRNDLLIVDKSASKNSQTKLSYYEYIWLRIVIELNKYGIDNSIIKEIKKNIVDKSFEKQMKEEIYKVKDKVKEYSDEAYDGLVMAEESTDHEIKEQVDEYLREISTPLFQMITYVVVSKLDAVLIVNRKGEFDVLTKFEAPNGALEFQYMYNQEDIKCKPHICIPLSNMIPEYLKVESIDCCSQPEKPLTMEEHELLKIVRGKRYGELKTISIEFKNGNPEILKAKEISRVNLESRLLDHIQDKGYHTIKFTTNNGKLVSFENERSHKIL